MNTIERLFLPKIQCRNPNFRSDGYDEPFGRQIDDV